MSDSLQPHGLYTPDSFIHGIFQVRILDCVAISFPRVSSQPRAWASISCVSYIGRQILYPRAKCSIKISCKNYGSVMGQLQLTLEQHGGNPPVTCSQPSIPAVAPNPGIQPIMDCVVL